MRLNDRLAHQLREIKLTRHYTKHAEGSVLVEFGDTRVLCTATVQSNNLPRFLKGKNQGWITAEYGMLPRSTHDRMDREAARGKQGGRTLEIQRLIGRALRSMVDLKQLGEHLITVDCDVIQADGGTRTAAITGSCVALIDALTAMKLPRSPIKHYIAAVSVGIYEGVPLLDLNYDEDSKAETDMNVIMTEAGGFIEIQGTAEAAPYTEHELQSMLELAKEGIKELIVKQKQVLSL